jgi:geranylgeranyl pyrophosphate synthase
VSTIPPPVTRVMQEAQAWLPPRLAAVERRLGELVGGHGEMLAADAGATLAAGGKRMRPLLVLLCAGPGSDASAVRAATAVELVHMATLVHDDVLDGAPLRRGHPTVAARSGRERAVATGDLLFSRAFAELGTNGGTRQVELLSSASVALAVGELAQRRDAFDISITAQRYLKRCLLKTARLFECACVIGAAGLREDAGGNGGPHGGEGLAVFGRHIGLAFQLLDDVLDVTGPPERTGKAVGTDLLDGTVTLPLILARESDEGLADVDLRSLDEEGAADVCRRIAATDALDRVREMARHRVEDAKESLRDAGVTPDQRRLLDLVADGVVERYS